MFTLHAASHTRKEEEEEKIEDQPTHRLNSSPALFYYLYTVHTRTPPGHTPTHLRYKSSIQQAAVVAQKAQPRLESKSRQQSKKERALHTAQRTAGTTKNSRRAGKRFTAEPQRVVPCVPHGSCGYVPLYKTKSEGGGGGTMETLATQADKKTKKPTTY